MSGCLLDTHALIWWMTQSPLLPEHARSQIEQGDHAVYASAVSAYEISWKHALGKLDLAQSLLRNYEADLVSVGLAELPISTAVALAAGQLPQTHRDPFDRLLIAQAKAYGLTLISNEELFDQFGVDRVWA